MDIVRIAALGIVGALLGILLKGQKKEYELFVTLGVSQIGRASCRERV